MQGCRKVLEGCVGPLIPLEGIIGNNSRYPEPKVKLETINSVWTSHAAHYEAARAPKYL